MNLALKLASAALVGGLFSLTAEAEISRDCKEMAKAQAQVARGARLLSNPSASPKRVDIRSEYAALNIAGIKLRVLGANARCEMKLSRVTPENVTVHYGSPLSVSREDKFELSKSREILVWKNTNRKGISTVYKFGPSGEVVSTYESEENL